MPSLIHPLMREIRRTKLVAPSSTTIAAIFKAAKQSKAAGSRLAAANRKPHIDKVFEILKALPDMAVFANDQELDDYLDAMQSQVKGN